MTLKEIAAEAGVSISTVSRVINKSSKCPASQEVQDRIWEIVRRTGYVPNSSARELKMGIQENTGTRSRSIACIFARVSEKETDSFFAALARSIEKEAFRYNYILKYTFTAFDINHPGTYRLITDNHVDGVAVLGRCDKQLLKFLKRYFKCVAYTGLNSLDAKYDQIICSGYDTAVTAVNHLLSLGHRQIAYIGETEHEDRYRGYCDALAAAKIPFRRELTANVALSSEGGYRGAGSLLDKNCGATAYFCPNDITAIGVTYGPGLVGALLVGVAEAKAIAYAAKKPLVGVHHIEGHIAANFIEHKDLEPPFFSLVVSGGHTHLVRVKDYGKFDIIGRTRDDAAGEAFDKVARAIGLGYPGGPKIDKVSKEGNPEAIAFPRAHVEDAPYDFSFSGLKSAVLNYINGCQMKGIEYNQADIAASFQKAVTDVLVANAMHAVEEFHVDKLAIAGGVASNSALRAAMKEACEKRGVEFYYPSPIFCTDNAAMIGVAAYYEYINGTRSGWDLNAVPNLKLGER